MRLNLVGLVFDRLKVIEDAGKDKNNNSQWLCRCDCGVEKIIRGFSLRDKSVRSCGCLRTELAVSRAKHGQSNTATYNVWKAMWYRCTNRNGLQYAEYEFRVPPDRWKDYSNFLADVGPRPSSLHSIERIDNALPYSPENCKWATRREQNRNTTSNRHITFNGETHIAVVWSEITGINYAKIVSRLDVLGWTVEKTLTTH